ncbi:hypothetical protein YPPY08_1244, partial [Yersinia pestis PY-08]
MTPTTPQRLLA